MKKYYYDCAINAGTTEAAWNTSAPVSNWKGIESAPKGERVLISGYNHGCPDKGRWVHTGIRYPHRPYWFELGSSEEGFNDPTHWMPLPLPPEARK